MTQTWKEVLKEEQIFKTNWSAYGEELLKKYIICGGKPVILQVTFNGCSWVKNQLIFKATKPFIETIKTPKRICGGMTFPVDTLWKARLLLTASDKETFYLIGRIRIIYENGRPKGTMQLAEDIVSCPIMTERWFLNHYPQFREQCYIWPTPNEIIIEIPAKIRKRKNRNELLLMRSLSKKQTYYYQVIKRNRRSCQIEKPEIKEKEISDVENEFVLQENKPQKENRMASTEKAIAIIDDPLKNGKKRSGRDLDVSVSQAAEVSFIEGERKEVPPEIPVPDEMQFLKEYLGEPDFAIKCEAIFNEFNSPLGRRWLLEFDTTKKQIEYAGCSCQFTDGIIYVNSYAEQWLIRYSDLFKKMILYHKNRKGYRINTDREPIRGYHVQHIPSLINMKADEIQESQEEEDSIFRNYKDKPTIKDYIKYIRQHRELAVQRDKRQKRKRKELRDVLKDRNVSYQSKQRKLKKLRKAMKHEMASDVLHLLNTLKAGTDGEE